jgi:hypothetical protein
MFMSALSSRIARRTSRWGALACGLGTVVLLGVVPVQAATNATPSTDVPDLVVVSQPFTVLTDVNAKFDIAIPTTVTVNDADHLVLRLHRRVVSRDSLASIASHAATSAVTDVFSLPIYSIPRDSVGHLAPIIPITTQVKSSTALNLPFEGVYPVSISIVRNGVTTPLASVLTYLNRRDVSQPQPQIHVGVYASLVTAPSTPALMADGTVAVTDAIRKKTSDFIALLQATSAPLTLLVEPQLIDALNSSTVPADQSLLRQLRTLLRTHSVVTSTYATTDAAALVRAGLGDAFTSQLRLGEQTLNHLLPGVVIQRTTWVTSSPLDKPTTDFLRQLGITAFVIGSQAQSSLTGDPRSGVVARPSGHDNAATSVVGVDEDTIANDGSATSNPVVTGALAASFLLAERDDLIAKGVPADHINLLSGRLDPNTAPSSITLETVVSALQSTPGMTMVDYGNPQTVPDPATTYSFLDAAANTMSERAPSIQLAQRELSAVGSMLSEDDPRGDTWSHLLGVGISTSSSTPSIYISALRRDLRKVREAITVATPSSIALSSRSGTIRIQLRNASASSLSVRVRLTSPKLQFTKQPGVVTLVAGGTTDVEVAAESRSNGQVPVVVWVFTPSGGVEIGSPHTITARVTVFAGFGQLVSFTLLLVLLAWWWSHWRRSRRGGAPATTVSHS